MSASKPGSAYQVNASWSAAARATRYVVKLTNATTNAVLDSGSVTTTSWTANTTASVGTNVRVTVKAYNVNRAGGSVTKTVLLPDVTAPLATYQVIREAGHERSGKVRVALTALTDDWSTAGATQTIAWDDPTSEEQWPTTPLPSSTSEHTYPDADAHVFHPTVTVEDASHNQRVYTLAIAVSDSEAPTGSYEVTRTSAWASWTKVSVTPLLPVHDNASAPADVVKVIDWNDGTPQQQWSGATPAPTHVYAAAGSYTPKVSLVDEAGNLSALQNTSTVVVKADTVKPTLRLLPPKTRKAYVGSWRTLKGRATDAQTGVRNVVLQAIEKRGTSWYAYKASTHTWVKVGTKAKAWSKATLVSVKPAAAGTWSVKLAKLTKGTLIYRARAFDNRANASGWAAKKAVLTKR